MACSKIFSGEFPELTYEIIKYFRKDFSILYSCILVNKLWCRLAIPLLWEDPFSKNYPKNYHFIEIYLNELNEDDKLKLNEYGINNLLSPSSTLFNYPRFIKCLNTQEVVFFIKNWVGTLVDKNHEKLVSLINRLLFKVFIENEGILNSFEVILTLYNDLAYFNDNMDLILQNPNLTYNIRNLKLAITCPNPTQFLKFLYTNCKSISSIALSFPIYSNVNNRSLVEKYLSQIIISQHNLKKVLFESDTMIYHPFLALKNPNCSNTLNTIKFVFIDFKNIVSILQEVFDQLNVLESIHIFCCKSLNSDFAQQIIKVNKPFKLRSLFMDEILHIESLQLFIQKFSDWLENFGFGDTGEYNKSKRQLYEFIIKYCKKIRYFEPGIANDDNIYPLIKNNQYSINYLSIDVNLFNNSTDLSSTILQNLGQVLPPKLEYLRLCLCINTSDLEIFLKNSQNTFIKKLLIKHRFQDDAKNILLCIKEYIMKKERVKYLAILLKSNFRKNAELFYLEDEVNEFKLHNIIVEKFDDLCIGAFNFMD